ncbi:MAG: OmpA family protein [Paludibacteraceae bacterium]|nr:OmpA family protein [Paludibacteraceae bacterium]
MKTTIILIAILCTLTNITKAQETKKITINNLQFDTKNEIVASSANELTPIIKKLKTEKHTEIQLTCLAPQNTPDADAQITSANRILSVRKYFVKHEIPAYRVTGTPTTTKATQGNDNHLEISINQIKEDKDYIAPFILNNVKFSNLSDTLYSSSYTELNKLAKTLNMKPSLKIKIITHATTLAGSDYNKTISEKRAIAIINYLISKKIKEDRLTYQAMGDTQPITLEQGETETEQNSRVEIAFKKE